MKAILLRRPGGPEALEYVEVPTPVPGEGKVLVKADTIGVSMPEVLVRRGTYAWMPPLPAIPGIELSGTVVAHGPNTAEPALGQPVFVSARDLPIRAGCYAEHIAVPARAAHPLPPGCSLEAAACLSNYQVAYHVLHTAARGVEAKRVLVHTAAGGVGSAAVQLALIAGLEVIGVAGSEKKTRAILGLSAQHAIDYRSEDVVARVRELTGGRGADLILDPIGGKGFGRNFDMLAPLGMVVSYGRLDGPPDADLLTAMRANSAKSPAVRFFTIHSFDDRPDIRAAGRWRTDARACAARLGGDPEQPRRRTRDAWRAGERDGAPRRGGRRLPCCAGGMDSRAGAARLGDDPEQPRQRAQEARRAGEQDGPAGRGSRRLRCMPHGYRDCLAGRGGGASALAS